MFLLLVSEWRGSVTLNRPNANLDSKNDAFFVNLEYGIIHRDAFDFYRSQFSSELWSSPTEEPQNKFRVKLCHSEHLSLYLTIINVSFSRKNHGSTALNYDITGIYTIQTTTVLHIYYCCVYIAYDTKNTWDFKTRYVLYGKGAATCRKSDGINRSLLIGNRETLFLPMVWPILCMIYRITK